MRDRIFSEILQHSLVYTACWEDPRVDRAALEINDADRLLVITSAGCNVLDYLLDEPAHIFAVDINPRQNALLELKLAAIRRLDFETYFAMFGRGRLHRPRAVYRDKLRHDLSQPARRFWDRHIDWFDGRHRRTFYYRGTAGTVAYATRLHIDYLLRVRPWVDALLAADSIQAQTRIYEQHLRDRFWSWPLKTFLRGNLAMALSGVPLDQRQQIERTHGGNVAQYLQDRAEELICRRPLADNYFWRVYLTGKFTQVCCPAFLLPENHQRLKCGLIDRVSAHTDSVRGFVEKSKETATKYILLDHMDWLCGRQRNELQGEWQAIVDRAAGGARIIWRSGSPTSAFVDCVEVTIDGRVVRLGDVLHYHRRRAAKLHEDDRCHTYASFHIADLPPRDQTLTAEQPNGAWGRSENDLQRQLSHNSRR